VDAGRLVVGHREQDLDQTRPLKILVIGPVAEDLLELIDQEEEVFVFLEPGVPCRRGETVFARIDQDPESGDLGCGQLTVRCRDLGPQRPQDAIGHGPKR
jgi:hypothetical protein